MPNPTGSAILLAVLVSIAPARAQNASASGERPWLDATLLAAAKGEGSLIVYSSTNEQEGLPLFKQFTDATGIAVAYVRASDAVLMSRMGIEFRAGQKSYDIVQTATINKMPPQMLAAYEPPEAKNVATPAYNALVRRGLRFRYAYATVPQTLPSHEGDPDVERDHASRGQPARRRLPTRPHDHAVQGVRRG